ncbi:MAG: transposase zinc-binding domain-containing protein, partial [Acidobacteriota bacterium]|nr:transposase zinc-binding domain-containing protein [Acidobacteriota bacterium]
MLYRVVADQLETFLARAHDRGRPPPRFVEREFRHFLKCGIFAHGFLRVHCDACNCDRLVPFSCKGRGFCSSCGGRRMADTAAHLVDRVLPEAPVRQWVLSLPFSLRYRLAYDAHLTRDVLRIFVRRVFASLRRRARRRWPMDDPQCGAVTFVQRFGGALNLNVHFHTLVLDGVHDLGDGVRFRPLPPPDDNEVERVARSVARGIARLLERR